MRPFVVIRFLWVCVFCTIAAAVGLGQSLPGSGVQELLALSRRTQDAETWEVLAKALERQMPVTSQDVRMLIEALDHPRADIQRAAVMALANGKAAEAAPYLLTKLEEIYNQTDLPQTEADRPRWNQNAFLAESVVAALAFIGDERAVAPLLNYPEFFTSHMGVKPLAAFGARVLPDLLDIARQPQDPRRPAILSVLANLRDREAIPRLLEALQDADGEIRKSALSALRALQASEAEPVLETLLADPDADTRLAALFALTEMAPEKYRPTMLLFLQDPNPVVRSQVADQIARFKRVDATPALERLLRDPSDIVRFRAAKALEKLTGRPYPYKRSNRVKLLEELMPASTGKN